MATIRDLSTGQMFDGPDDAAVPPGYEAVSAPETRSGSGEVLESPTGSEARSDAWIVKFPTRGASAVLPVKAARLMTGIDKPHGLEDIATLALVNTLPIGAAGSLAARALPQLGRVAAPLARIATAMGLAKGRGEDTTTTLLEGAGAGMAEGAGAIARKALGGPATALEAIRSRIGKGPDGPVNLQLLDRLLSWWKADPNAAVQAQRASVVARQLAGLDPSKESARLFHDAVAKGSRIPVVGTRLPPMPIGLSEVAQRLTGPAGRSVADAAMSADPVAPVAAAYGASQIPASALRLFK